MEQKTEYCFVVDKQNRPLAPTKVKKGWYLIRKGRVKLKSKYPMIIQLEKEAEPDEKDENLRKAAILRDDVQCQECGKKNGVLEVHHILAKRLSGADTIGNLITLCSNCHQKTEGREPEFEERYFSKIQSKPKRFDYAMHVMQGKNYLREKISELGSLHLTNGGETANKRIEWKIEKSHSNDAVCITDCIPDTCDVKEWTIKSMRRKSKAKTENVLGIKHRDLVSYTYRNGETHTGYVTALYPELTALNFQSPAKHCKKVNARKCRLLWKYNKIYWFDNVI